ncbi:MAG TPA: cyclic beta 1-2 glucan synthetase, partial [Planctomycetaceae bacterium]
MTVGTPKAARDGRRNRVPDGLKRPHGLLSRLRLEEEPMRAEFLSLEQLHRHGQSLAIWHRLAAKQRRDRLLARLNENERVLEETRLLLARSAAEGHAIPPAGDWLLDNYYLIQSQIRLARQHLPRRYSMELPQLAGGPSDGLPRVYDIALELISHVDGLVDAKNVERFVSAYQGVQHLRLGELWAIPIMLRLALIENLRRVALRVAWQHNDRRLGEQWASRVAEAAGESFGRLIHAVAELVDHEPPITSGFVSRFTQSLQGRLPTGNVVTAWLEQHLSRQGQTVERLINADSQAMAADQVSMGNSITSLRVLESLDWKEFVERQSVVERALRQDPAGVYPAMSFSSRDRYRHVVERIARRSPLTEEQVARLAVEQARAAAAEAAGPAERGAYGTDGRRSHVGYYLVDKGRERVEQGAGYRPTPGDRVARAAERFPLACYLGAAGVVLSVLLAAFVGAAQATGAAQALGVVGLAGLTALLAVAGSQAAVSLVNWAVTLLVKPRPVMRLDFTEGIDREFRTLVVVPTMLTGPKAVRSLIDQLEV